MVFHETQTQARPTTKTKGTMTDVAQPAAGPVPVAAVPVRAAAPARGTNGMIKFTKAGGRYHTDMHCWHVLGKTITEYLKCKDCVKPDA